MAERFATAFWPRFWRRLHRPVSGRSAGLRLHATAGWSRCWCFWPLGRGWRFRLCWFAGNRVCSRRCPSRGRGWKNSKSPWAFRCWRRRCGWCTGQPRIRRTCCCWSFPGDAGAGGVGLGAVRAARNAPQRSGGGGVRAAVGGGLLRAFAQSFAESRDMIGKRGVRRRWSRRARRVIRCWWISPPRPA